MQAARVSEGKTVLSTNSSGGAYTVGDIESRGELVALVQEGGIGSTGPNTTLANGAEGSFLIDDVVEGPYETGVAAVVGQRAYWDATGNQFSTYPDGNVYAGVFARDVASAGTRCYVKLNTTVAGAGLMYVNEAASAVSPAGTDEAAFSKSFTIPANTLKAGDIVRIKAAVTVADQNSTDTLTLKLKIGSTQIATTGAVDVADADVGRFDVDLVIRTAGAAGTLFGHGTHALGVPGTVTAKPFVLAEAAVDTTATQLISVTYTWSVSHADNDARLDVLSVEIIRK